MCVISYAHLTFLLLWPWPWPDDLGIRIWSRYFEDVPSYQTQSFLVKAFESSNPNRTDRQTDAHPHRDRDIHRQTDKRDP